jgi:hypothetical protein
MDPDLQSSERLDLDPLMSERQNPHRACYECASETLLFV